MNQFHENAIYWVEVGKISPNPYQPRREFDEEKLQALSDSIRQYGVLQPLVVTRKEVYRDDGSMVVEYELIAGERRLRAARLAGVMQVPVVIRSDDEGENVKLELAIIENLQREDLNPVDRAQAFSRLAKEFGYKHTEIADKVGKSREYVSNTLRLLNLPEEMLQALAERRISEGHTRPLLMLTDHEKEQGTLFKEILYRKLTVRDAESISRRIAKERVRKKDDVDPQLQELEDEASETLGRRVRIATRKVGGQIMIDFDSDDDLKQLIVLLRKQQEEDTDAAEALSQEAVPQADQQEPGEEVDEQEREQDMPSVPPWHEEKETRSDTREDGRQEEDSSNEEEDDDVYGITHFSI